MKLDGRPGMKLKSSLSRRAFLEGAGLGAVALPFLRSAAGAAPLGTKRLVIFATANGTVMRDFFPATADGPYPAILKPLEMYRAKLNVMRGLNMESAYKSPVPRDHLPDNANMLTARQASTDGKVGGISIDQHIANTIGLKTKFASLHFGVRVGGYAAHISARGVAQGVFPENSPQKAFDRIFKDVVADPADLARARAEKTSMLDALKAELGDLRCALGADERPKFEAHMDSLRELEKSLSVTVAAGCRPPMLGAAPATDSTGIPTAIRQHMDLVVGALACDLTRVVTLQLGNGSGGLGSYRWIGIEGTHHGISHGSEGVTAPQADRERWLTQIETWLAEQFAYLVGKLHGVVENGAPLLDTTATMWAHEQSNGGSHLRKDMPWIMAGGMGGTFKTGRVIHFMGKPHNGLLISLANGMGVPTDAFGDADFSKGPLAGL
jgi:hypothetical protein